LEQTIQMKDDQTDDFFTEGTYASPRYFIPEDSPAHAEALKIFQKIKWAKPPKRAVSDVSAYGSK
jgi:hypothetical protein